MDYGNTMVGAQGRHPLVSFGVISDVQYADILDGRSFHGVPRYYRHSLLVLQRAVQHWNEKKLNFVINFGDIIDGKCPKSQSLNSIQKVVNEFSTFNGPVYHMIGNHCLYNVPHEKVLPLLNIPSQDGHAYYDFSPVSQLRFVVLDGFDISAIGWPEDHPNNMKAMNILRERNPNLNKNSPSGLVGVERRFVMFNGAVGEEQLKWLEQVLQEATNSDQKVLICSHIPLEPRATSHEALLWNYEQVLEVIHRYRCVKVCMSGHNHEDGYFLDSNGLHHRVLEAALECAPGRNAFGSVEVFHDRLVLSGSDRLGSKEMVFNDYM